MGNQENKCPKCNFNMSKVDVNLNFGMYGKEEQHPPFAPYQASLNPSFSLVCEKCGYIEFYTTIKK